MAFFERLSDTRYLPTAHVGGAWNTNEQHIAPAMGLLAHHLERDAAARGHGFLIGRLSYDILGTIPIEAMDAHVQVLRGGRTIELVEATLSHQDRAALRVRAWLMRPNDTGDCRHAAGAHRGCRHDARMGSGDGVAGRLHRERADPPR